jgi:hypothetical protein
MPAEFAKPAPPSGGIIADRRLWTDIDRTRLLEEGHPDAAFLLAAEDSEILVDQVKALDLEIVDGKVKQHGHKAEEFASVKEAAAKKAVAKKTARKSVAKKSARKRGG